MIKSMKKTISMISCPSCAGVLRPQALVCDDCDIKVEGSFAFNEFSALNSEDLHFLRVFLQCEGRIRDMETALGLSYPTVRARLSGLKEKVLGLQADDELSESPAAAPSQADVQTTLEALEKKEITFDEALKKIQKNRK